MFGIAVQLAPTAGGVVGDRADPSRARSNLLLGSIPEPIEPLSERCCDCTSQALPRGTCELACQALRFVLPSRSRVRWDSTIESIIEAATSSCLRRGQPTHTPVFEPLG